MYKFKSRAAGDVLMTQPVGDRVLALIGKGALAQGIVDVAQLPAAIQALEAAVAAEAVPAAAEREDDDAKGAHAGADNVSLRQRAWPLVEMMRRSLAEDEPIVWGV
jgi:hypothetical protein